MSNLTDPRLRLRELIERIARIAAAEDRPRDLNPAQQAALSYLARANRFSRSPSQVAEYLAATRGTVSQTLRGLARKGLVVEHRSAVDRRSITYDITERGRAALKAPSAITAALEAMDGARAAALAEGLEALLRAALARQGGRAFGVCRTCRHYRPERRGGTCTLLGEPLSPADGDLICHEHEAPAPAHEADA